jgi:hypothetical protein
MELLKCQPNLDYQNCPTSESYPHKTCHQFGRQLVLEVDPIPNNSFVIVAAARRGIFDWQNKNLKGVMIAQG